MFQTIKEAMHYIQENDIKIVDFKVVDMIGRWRHLAIPAKRFDESIMENGIGFDGSSYGFLSVERSDMVFKPDVTTAFLDPFTEQKTLTMIADIYYIGETFERFEGDPRYISEKAESYLKTTGIGDEILFGPEFEFNVFDHVSFNTRPEHQEVMIDCHESFWNSEMTSHQNLGYKQKFQKGYHSDLPYDETNDFRSVATTLLEGLGVDVKYHHHEVGASGQVEIETDFGTMHKMADNTLLIKYILKNLAIERGQTVTFMPKPLYGEAGNGFHVHMILKKDGKPVFYDSEGYASLSQEALYFIGGVLKHSPALLAFTNPSTNSYKRLVPGYEAPVNLCFGMANRSAVIRIPAYAKKPDKKRFEFRSQDATCNPYLSFSALLMAGLDGIKNKIDPTDEGFGPYDVNVFNLPEEERNKIKCLPRNLDEAADALEIDNKFLLEGNVFTEGLIKDQIVRLRRESKMINTIPNPKEFELYYDL
jgi:glutamine synthetase